MARSRGDRRFEPDCSQCHDPCNRERWGCDAPAEKAVVELSPCPLCDGEPGDCPVCFGTNVLQFDRCPTATLALAEQQLVQAAVRVESGILPDEGAWLDQAATFVAAYPLVVGELARWQRYYDEVDRRNADRKR